MTDCPNGDIRDLLPELVNDRLAPSQRAEVEAHVRTCDDCREELELLRGMRRSMHRAPAIAVADIVSALPAYRAPVRRIGNGWRIAAALMLLAGGGTSLLIAHNGGLPIDSARVAIVPSSPVVAQTPATTPVATPEQRAVQPSGAAAATSPASSSPRELAVASASVGDLSEAELSALVNDLGSLDAVTPADVDQPAPVSPIPPSVTSGTGA